MWCLVSWSLMRESWWKKLDILDDQHRVLTVWVLCKTQGQIDTFCIIWNRIMTLFQSLGVQTKMLTFSLHPSCISERILLLFLLLLNSLPKPMHVYSDISPSKSMGLIPMKMWIGLACRCAKTIIWRNFSRKDGDSAICCRITWLVWLERHSKVSQMALKNS